jgi:hypothetical protein
MPEIPTAKWGNGVSPSGERKAARRDEEGQALDPQTGVAKPSTT